MHDWLLPEMDDTAVDAEGSPQHRPGKPLQFPSIQLKMINKTNVHKQIFSF